MIVHSRKRAAGRKADIMNRMWGVEVRTRTVTSTQFVCPRCGLDRDGTEVEPQRWFTVLGLPLVPLASLDRMIECNVCAHRCDLGVLEIPTSDVLETYIDDATRHAVATVVRAGTAPGEAVSDMVCDAAVAVVISTGHAYDRDQLLGDVTGLDDIDTDAHLHRLEHELTPHGKQGFLHRMATLALVDAPMSAAEQQSIVRMGVALGMSAPHINGVIAIASLHLEAA